MSAIEGIHCRLTETYIFILRLNRKFIDSHFYCSQNLPLRGKIMRGLFLVSIAKHIYLVLPTFLLSDKMILMLQHLFA